MTDKDATRQKLVNSMRKTKAGVAAQADAPMKTDAGTPVKKTSRSKKPAVKPKPSAVQNKPVQPAAYQSRRVWPD